MVVVIPETERALIEHARALIDWIESGGDPMNSPESTLTLQKGYGTMDGHAVSGARFSSPFALSGRSHVT